MKNSFHCQKQYDSYTSSITTQRCRTQCETCKTAKEKIKAHKKAKNKRKNQRYYLHSVIKKQGCTFNARSRTIFVPYTQTEFSKQVIRLRDEFGYNVQTELI